MDALGALVASMEAAPCHRAEEAISIPRIVALARAAFVLFTVGKQERASALLSSIEAIAAGLEERDPLVAARLHSARTTRAMWTSDLAELLRLSEVAAARYEAMGDARALCSQHVNIGFALCELGQYARAEGHLRRAIELGLRIGHAALINAARHNLGNALCELCRLDEARAVEQEAVDALLSSGDLRLEHGSRIYLSTIALRAGDLREAEAQARRAADGSRAIPNVRAQALGALSAALLASGRAAEALEVASESMDMLQELSGLEEGESAVRLAHAEALHACGQLDEARAAIAVALARVRERAAKITDEALRRGFVEDVRDNAGIARRAGDWG